MTGNRLWKGTFADALPTFRERALDAAAKLDDKQTVEFPSCGSGLLDTRRRLLHPPSPWDLRPEPR